MYFPKFYEQTLFSTHFKVESAKRRLCYIPLILTLTSDTFLQWVTATTEDITTPNLPRLQIQNPTPVVCCTSHKFRSTSTLTSRLQGHGETTKKTTIVCVSARRAPSPLLLHQKLQPQETPKDHKPKPKHIQAPSSLITRKQAKPQGTQPHQKGLLHFAFSAIDTLEFSWSDFSIFLARFASLQTAGGHLGIKPKPTFRRPLRRTELQSSFGGLLHVGYS